MNILRSYWNGHAFIWYGTRMVNFVVWFNIIECRSYSDHNLLDGVTLTCDIQVIGVDKAVRIFMYRLIIRIDVEQNGQQDTCRPLFCFLHLFLTIQFSEESSIAEHVSDEISNLTLSVILKILLKVVACGLQYGNRNQRKLYLSLHLARSHILVLCQIQKLFVDWFTWSEQSLFIIIIYERKQYLIVNTQITLSYICIQILKYLALKFEERVLPLTRGSVDFMIFIKEQLFSRLYYYQNKYYCETNKQYNQFI